LILRSTLHLDLVVTATVGVLPFGIEFNLIKSLLYF
jgi:hypothetical protein